jgi:hypothetical protein
MQGSDSPSEAPDDSSRSVGDQVSTAIPPVSELSENSLSAMRHRERELNALRRRGVPLFSVYLASFRSQVEARDFAQALCARRASWTDPMFVEKTQDQPSWYRVLVGGFEKREAARITMRELRGSSGVTFAQLDRLPADAEPLIPNGAEFARLEEAHE